LSIGFRDSVSLHSAIQATRLLTVTSVGLPPTEHTSFLWTRFRTAGFLRYGLKAGYRARPSPLPGLPSSFVRAAASAIPCSVSGAGWSTQHLHASGYPLYPRGPRSGRVMLSRPSPLTWPHAPHSPAHPDFAALRFIRDALAVPKGIGLGSPRVVLSFH
jgi:hypothetical protein